MGKKLLKLFCFGILLLSVGDGVAQLYSNGLLATGTIASDGFTAPTGYSWSELQNNTGNNSQVNATAGLPGYYYADGSLSYTLADDFIVPEGQIWSITSFDFFCYQPVYSGTIPPINQLKIRLYNSDPSLPSSTPLVGDLTTNVYDAVNSQNAFIYRIFNATIPSPQQPNFSRKVFKVRGTFNTTLPAGHYWVEFQAHATDNTEVFFPPVTVVGSRLVSGANSKINVISSFFPSDVLGWGTNSDGGIPTSAPDVSLAVPFEVNGTFTLSSDNYEQNETISLVPNPVNTKLFILSNSDLLIQSIEVFDLESRLVMSFNPLKSLDYQLDLGELTAGVYCVKIFTNLGNSIHKIIKK